MIVAHYKHCICISVFCAVLLLRTADSSSVVRGRQHQCSMVESPEHKRSIRLSFLKTLCMCFSLLSAMSCPCSTGSLLDPSLDLQKLNTRLSRIEDLLKLTAASSNSHSRFDECYPQLPAMLGHTDKLKDLRGLSADHAACMRYWGQAAGHGCLVVITAEVPVRASWSWPRKNERKPKIPPDAALGYSTHYCNLAVTTDLLAYWDRRVGSKADLLPPQVALQVTWLEGEKGCSPLLIYLSEYSC
jgi:hypothetical protein